MAHQLKGQDDGSTYWEGAHGEEKSKKYWAGHRSWSRDVDKKGRGKKGRYSKWKIVIERRIPSLKEVKQ